MNLSDKELLNRIISAYGSILAAVEDGSGEGICYSCGYIQEDVEPDAECYECDECGEYAVSSIENALLKCIH